MALVSGIFVLLLVICGFLAPVISPYPYDEPHYENAFQSSSWQFIMGTDDLGRDQFSRLLFSLRNALLVALGSQLVALIIGVALGAIAGFRGGWIDSAIMRIVDIMFAFPTFLFNIILVTVLGRGLFTIFLAIGLTSWAGIARLMRGQIMFLRSSEFVEAARAIGAKDGHIIAKYLLPNTLGPIIVSVVFGIPGAIWQESGLALIGMGLNPPMPSWGNLMGAGMSMAMGFPHLLLWPALTFALTLLAITFMGDGIQDALNPRSES
ncbi:MAG: ABC transporter permease [Fibrobacter sp.]|nr:ABC transporter permease [Fibrobacter sp.]